jgi:hypothetical protein
MREQANGPDAFGELPPALGVPLLMASLLHLAPPTTMVGSLFLERWLQNQVTFCWGGMQGHSRWWHEWHAIGKFCVS